MAATRRISRGFTLDFDEILLVSSLYPICYAPKAIFLYK